MTPVPAQNRRKAYSYIRMSTDAQLKGDSLRRQLENSSRYIEEHDLELVEDLRDLGVSAFRGANVEYGALGRFIQAVRSGHIAPGSYLIVEAFDRISRQPTRIALQLILELINSGITVVTLTNGQTYSSENYDTQQLIISIIEMSTAAEESAKKSQRVTAAWQAKRSAIAKKKLTSRGPAWLKYSTESGQFVPIADRVSVIQRIFDEAIIGIGAYTIAKRLNDEGIPTFGSSSRWQPSSVNKIIASPAVIGEFQLHKEEAGIRMAEGAPISGYFPKIIADDVYYAAQAARLGRKTTGGGRKGKYLSNIFAKLVYCYYCGGRMLFEDKGEGPRGNTYFVCMSVPTGSNCVRTRWRYDDFEASFLAFVKQVDLGSIFSAEQSAAKRASIEADLASSNGQLLLHKQKRDNVFDLSLQADMNVAYLATKLREFDVLIKKEEKKIRDCQEQLAEMSHAAANFYESRDQIKELIGRVKVKSDDNYKMRAQIASRLRSLIDRVDVAVAGQAPANSKLTEFLDGIRNDAASAASLRADVEEVSALHQESIDDKQHLRFFMVRFKNGQNQVVWPSSESPLQFEQRIAPVFEIEGERIQVT
jgi:DNA invertase Pin-like site-specific DNA recombinase